MVHRNSINKLLKNLRDTGTVNRLTDSRIAEDHNVPALKKMLT